MIHAEFWLGNILENVQLQGREDGKDNIKMGFRDIDFENGRLMKLS
jgi:hypothetical protein